MTDRELEEILLKYYLENGYEEIFTFPDFVKYSKASGIAQHLIKEREKQNSKVD
jgi:hypothetical protein